MFSVPWLCQGSARWQTLNLLENDLRVMGKDMGRGKSCDVGKWEENELLTVRCFFFFSTSVCFFHSSWFWRGGGGEGRIKGSWSFRILYVSSRKAAHLAVSVFTSSITQWEARMRKLGFLGGTLSACAVWHEKRHVKPRSQHSGGLRRCSLEQQGNLELPREPSSLIYNCMWNYERLKITHGLFEGFSITNS